MVKWIVDRDRREKRSNEAKQTIGRLEVRQGKVDARYADTKEYKKYIIYINV